MIKIKPYLIIMYFYIVDRSGTDKNENKSVITRKPTFHILNHKTILNMYKK